MADHETHVSFVRAMDLLGLGRSALRAVPSNADFTIDLRALEKMLDADIAAGMTPFCIVGHVGSINVGAIDDLDALADIAERRNLWLHLDGACGALAGMLPELRPQLSAMKRADSLSFDAHKWLGVPYEAGCIMVRDIGALPFSPRFYGRDRRPASTTMVFVTIISSTTDHNSRAAGAR